MFCCLYYLNYKHPSSFVREAGAVAAAGESVLDCTYGAGGHSVVFAKRHCRVCAVDCDIAALTGARVRSLTLQMRVNLYDRAHELVLIDTGVSLMQAKSYWRQFSKGCDSAVSAALLAMNTRMLFRHIVNSLTVGGRLLIMFYSLEFALLAYELSKTVPALYVLNRAFVRPSCVERLLYRCSSSARLLMFVKTN
ncbi:Ribosomal RNA small subunit methyltransferase H [Candidatus Hodgkinia cicadicola]|nr:Ribosomal RNA small subunit methyltransferase H [Candidatus Hodgkinia cicadicola]